VQSAEQSRRHNERSPTHTHSLSRHSSSLHVGARAFAMGSAAVLGTWRFSKGGVSAGAEVARSGGSALDAVVTAVRTVEHDPAVTSAGIGGLPNAAGVLQLDAALMTGSGRVGAVMALEGFPDAVSAADAVLRHCRHPVLAGKGAADFATAHGLERLPPEDLLTEHARKRYAEHCQGLTRSGQTRARDKCASDGSAENADDREMPHTDTVGIICRDHNGDIAVGCATSGMQFKDVGRVGDSPLVGAGLYADKAAGAAVASGDGDQMLRFCLAFLVVEAMRGGKTAQEACEAAVARVMVSDPGCQAAICAMEAATGRTGAACTRNGFYVVEWIEERDAASGPQTVHVAGAREAAWAHTCL
jgi:N4-(beta-N-acetylglucosaminyl)-L-asparaginase